VLGDDRHGLVHELVGVLVLERELGEAGDGGLTAGAAARLFEEPVGALAQQEDQHGRDEQAGDAHHPRHHRGRDGHVVVDERQPEREGHRAPCDVEQPDAAAEEVDGRERRPEVEHHVADRRVRPGADVDDRDEHGAGGRQRHEHPARQAVEPEEQQRDDAEGEHARREDPGHEGVLRRGGGRDEHDGGPEPVQVDERPRHEGTVVARDRHRVRAPSETG
jgi:hypothetical protein